VSEISRGRRRFAIQQLGIWLAIAASAVAVANGVQAEESGLSEVRQINLQVGYPPGGGYDAYGRLLARHIGRHLPGNPAIVVSNVPGAGSIILANNLYKVAPRDGSVIGMPPRAFAIAPGKSVWAWNAGTSQSYGQALTRCAERAKGPCQLYAYDDTVVWSPR